jgi:hypothetical protein
MASGIWYLAQLLQGIAEIAVGIGELRTQSQRLAIVGDGTLLEDAREVIPRDRKLGLDLDRLYR